ncbi:MAG: CrcB family protein [Eubacteriales bacterium]
MRKYLYIGILGAFGAIARYVVEKAPFSLPFYNFPINTLLINLLGCFLLAFIIELSYERKIVSSALRLGITTGFLGAFTTFSTLCKEVSDLLTIGKWLFALIYILSLLILGFLSIYTANKLAKAAIKMLGRKEEVQIWD